MKPVQNSQRRTNLIEEVDDEDVYMNGVNIAAFKKAT